MIIMGKEEKDMRIIAAVISSVLLENGIGESIMPTSGRDIGSSWSESHRRMSVGKSSLLNARSMRGAKR
ncbi:MAG: hypothetical protein CL975_01395 [Euryarchaeota archaeon]|nr:hypothetical protein [Euryarchaeota archaeon]